MKVQCPHCSQKYSITEEFFDNAMECQACGKSITFYAKDVLPSKDLQTSEQAQPQGKPTLITSAGSNPSLAGRSLVQHTPQKSSGQLAVITLLIALLLGGGFVFYQKSQNPDTETTQTEEVQNAYPASYRANKAGGYSCRSSRD